LIALVLAATAVANLFTKEVATVSGLIFTAIFLTTLIVSERYTNKSRGGATPEHVEQVSLNLADVLSDETVGLSRPFRKLVAVRSPEHLEILQRALEETDAETTEIIVVKAHSSPAWGSSPKPAGLGRYDQRLITAIIEAGETIGKSVKPLVVSTNNPLFAIANTAKSLRVQEVIVGPSHKFTPKAQLDKLAAYWNELHTGEAAPLTIRVFDPKLDVRRDIGGGSTIPKAGGRQRALASEPRPIEEND
jgi:hypothetical protein